MSIKPYLPHCLALPLHPNSLKSLNIKYKIERCFSTLNPQHLILYPKIFLSPGTFHIFSHMYCAFDLIANRQIKHEEIKALPNLA